MVDASSNSLAGGKEKEGEGCAFAMGLPKSWGVGREELYPLSSVCGPRRGCSVGVIIHNDRGACVSPSLLSPLFRVSLVWEGPGSQGPPFLPPPPTLATSS